MDNLVYNLTSSSDDEEDKDYENDYFMNNVKQDVYLENTKKLFCRDIEKKRLLINGSFNASNSFVFYLNGSVTGNEVGGLGKIDNVIGIQLIQTMIHSPIVSINIHTYVDIIIDEFPSQSCILNGKGKHIVARAPITKLNGSELNIHEPENLKDCNYFFPITFDRLTIKLEEPLNNVIFNYNADNSFEFELTILNNLDLIR